MALRKRFIQNEVGHRQATNGKWYPTTEPDPDDENGERFRPYRLPEGVAWAEEEFDDPEYNGPRRMMPKEPVARAAKMREWAQAMKDRGDEYVGPNGMRVIVTRPWRVHPVHGILDVRVMALSSTGALLDVGDGIYQFDNMPDDTNVIGDLLHVIAHRNGIEA